MIAGVMSFLRLGVKLPLSVSLDQIELHRFEEPRHATAACFARMADELGVVVAGHSFQGANYGDTVPLASGASGYFLRSGYKPIDAAFVATPWVSPKLRQLRWREFPIVGDEVTIRTRGDVERRAVVQVNNTLVKPGFSDYPVIFYMNRGCAYGDSGALVRLATGEAIGIYTGPIKLPIRRRRTAGHGTELRPGHLHARSYTTGRDRVRTTHD